MSGGAQNHNYSGLYTHSADENSIDNDRQGMKSWLDDKSQDNVSTNNILDSQSNANCASNGPVYIKKNVDGGNSVNSLTNAKSHKKNN